ncbi:MAG TPA: DoxX family membrane protein [Gemmatimonadales bacterium]
MLARLILGLSIASHGAQKLFGWFGGGGIGGMSGFFEQLGFRPGAFFVFAAGLGEFGGGLLTALGLLGPIGPALVIMVMIVAMIAVHWSNGFFNEAKGIELPLIYSAGAAGLAFGGRGAFSFDAALGLTNLWAPSGTSLAIGIGVLFALLSLVARGHPAHASQTG